MAKSKLIATPIKPRAPVENTEDSEPADRLLYQQAIGALMYLMLGTWLDLAFTVGYLSRFSSTPTTTHWKLIK